MTNFDYTQFWGGNFMKNLPGSNGFPFDVQAMMDAQRKNLQALTEAQQLAFKGAQAAAEKQREMLSKFVEDNSSLAHDIMSEGTPEEKVAKQADLFKNVYESSFSHYQELADIITKSNKQAADVISKRINATMNEMKGVLAETSKAAATKKAA